jgi:DNA-binding transcriptional MerR regulator
MSAAHNFADLITGVVAPASCWRLRGRPSCPHRQGPEKVLLDSRTGSRLHTETVTAAKTNLRSGELARVTGVSVDTIRHYERLGILPKAQRTPSGYRLYAPDAVERVQLARRSLQLGFSLAELAEILQTRDKGGAPCHRVLALAEGKLRSLREQIEELQRTQVYMRRLVRDWRRKLKNTPRGNRAMLLQLLTNRPKTTPTTNNLKRRSQ